MEKHPGGPGRVDDDQVNPTSNDFPESVISPTVAFTCASCGGHGAWHAERQDVVCTSCGKALALPPLPTGAVDRFDLIPLLRDRADSGRTWQPVPTDVRCLACHAITRLGAGIAAGRCDSCGATSLVIVDRSGAPISPTGVIPFRLSESAARETVRSWIVQHARRDFGRGRSAPIELRAVYVPWWDVFAHVNCPWRTESEHRRQDGTVKRTISSGTADLDFQEALPATRSAPTTLLVDADPYDAAMARPYDARYLAGTTVEHYTVNLWDAWDAGHARMQRRLDDHLSAGDGCLPDETWPTWTHQSARMVLVPVFMGTFGTGERAQPIVVNGVTGKVGGEWPWSRTARIRARIVLAASAAGVVAVAAGLLWGAWVLLKAMGFRPLW